MNYCSKSFISDFFSNIFPHFALIFTHYFPISAIKILRRGSRGGIPLDTPLGIIVFSSIEAVIIIIKRNCNLFSVKMFNHVKMRHKKGDGKHMKEILWIMCKHYPDVFFLVFCPFAKAFPRNLFQKSPNTKFFVKYFVFFLTRCQKPLLKQNHFWSTSVFYSF